MSAKRRDRKKRLVKKYLSQKTGVWHNTEANYKFVLNIIKYEEIYILFKTGLRISEFVGLTFSDIDMHNRTINVDHQLQRKRNMEYIIEDTNMTSGTRIIPMSDGVYECFQRILANRKK
ncbi:Transposase from transposon Tn916 [Clostridiales bacterium CHKCI001]|nr:Transposase from transposon Tn916 [Clostridiales bacterium CHKCI001]